MWLTEAICFYWIWYKEPWVFCLSISGRSVVLFTQPTIPINSYNDGLETKQFSSLNFILSPASVIPLIRTSVFLCQLSNIFSISFPLLSYYQDDDCIAKGKGCFYHLTKCKNVLFSYLWDFMVILGQVIFSWHQSFCRGKWKCFLLWQLSPWQKVPLIKCPSHKRTKDP